MLLSVDGVSTVESVGAVDVRVETVFDLTVDGFHTFHVVAGDEAVLVHNSNPKPGCDGVPDGADIANADDAPQSGGQDIYRGMRDAGGAPELGPSARTLGARTDDIPVGADGLVRPGTGGMSVSPGAPGNLPPHRRPSGFGGTGKDPVWCASTCDLPDGLTYRPDPSNPGGHGFIEPASPMTFDAYQGLLEQTQSIWSKVGQ